MGGSSGGGGGSTTTVQKTEPWKQQKPYLMEIFGEAQKLFKDPSALASLGYQSPLYQNYIQALLGQNVPFEAGASQAINQALGANQFMLPYAQGMAQVGGAQNLALPSTQQLAAETATGTGVAAPLTGQMAALQQAGYGALANPAIAALAAQGGAQWADPWAAALGQSAGAVNPYTAATAGASQLALANPALAQLAETAGGEFLTPDKNPFLQQAVQNALEQARGAIAGQFAGAGRYGSGAMQGVQAQELGKIATGAYAQAYEAERARQEAAKQALGQQYLGGIGQLIGGQQAAGGLAQGNLGQAIQALQAGGGLAGSQQQLLQAALGEAGQQFGQGAQTNVAAQQAAASAAQNQIQNALAATQMLGGLSAEDLSRALQGLQAAGGTTAQSLAMQANALQPASLLQQMQQIPLSNIGAAAQLQTQLGQQQAATLWENLANYLAMVQGAYGGTGTITAPRVGGGGSPWGAGLGGALMGAGAGSAIAPGIGTGLGALLGGLGGFFSSKTMKAALSDANPEEIARKLKTIPIDIWRYHGGQTVHIGPYAEDFRDAFGVGDGFAISFSDMLGVMLVTIQHLMARVDALEKENSVNAVRS